MLVVNAMKNALNSFEDSMLKMNTPENFKRLSIFLSQFFFFEIFFFQKISIFLLMIYFVSKLPLGAIVL
jgi:hypothetical protein